MFVAGSSQFRKVPEGFRKLVRKLVSFLYVCLQFRKVPEGLRKLVRKLVWRHRFTAFRKLPEGFRKPYRKRCGTGSDWLTSCKLDKFTSFNIFDQHRPVTNFDDELSLELLSTCHFSDCMVGKRLSRFKNSSQISGSFSEAFRKISGSWQEICAPGAASGPFRLMLCFTPNGSCRVWRSLMVQRCDLDHSSLSWLQANSWLRVGQLV